MVIRRADDVEHFGPSWNRRLICAAHVLHTKAHAGDLQCAQFATLGDRRQRMCPGRTLGIVLRLA